MNGFLPYFGTAREHEDWNILYNRLKLIEFYQYKS